VASYNTLSTEANEGNEGPMDSRNCSKNLKRANCNLAVLGARRWSILKLAEVFLGPVPRLESVVFIGAREWRVAAWQEMQARERVGLAWGRDVPTPMGLDVHRYRCFHRIVESCEYTALYYVQESQNGEKDVWRRNKAENIFWNKRPVA
jgi:hypothetical protein